jgi:Leucine-rich repeat (LRR) protein
MKGLEYLNLSCNYLDGPIHEGLGGMRKLRSLDFSHNVLSGELPPGIASMTKLEVLNLSHNSLSGPLPQQLTSYGNSQEHWQETYGYAAEKNASTRACDIWGLGDWFTFFIS